jgi:hypothetical protein
MIAKGDLIFMKMLVIAIASASLASAATAQVAAFTDRATFIGSAGSVLTEGFNGVVADTQFTNNTLAFTGFRVRADDVSGFAPGLNFVDVPALAGGSITPASYDVDGTALLTLGINTGISVTFTFNRPITAVGFDTRRMQNQSDLIQIEVGGTTQLPPVLPLFVGYVSTTPFTTLTFNRQAIATSGDGFSVDNLTFSSSAAVPEPANWAMLIAGFGLVGTMARRRRALLA